MMLRTAGQVISRQFRFGPRTAAPLSVRHFSDGGGDGRLVPLSTKQEYVDFERKKSVVYFTAKWCPPCRRIGPFLAELSTETPGVAFGKVDIDDNEEAAQMAGIKSVPTFKFFKEGEEYFSMSGADAEVLERNVQDLDEI